MAKTQSQTPPGKRYGGSRVAAFLDEHMAASDKTLREIAEEIGYERPNVLSNMRTGATKLPLPKVVPMARALDVDPLLLLRMALMEYNPETLKAIEEIVGFVVTKNEHEILELVREASDNGDPTLRQCDRESLRQWAKGLAG